MNTYRTSLKALSLSVAVIGLTAGSAHAGGLTPIYGGGGTFAFKGLLQLSGCTGTAVPGYTESSFCANKAGYPYEYLFAGTGSGAGLDALITETSVTGSPGSNTPYQDTTAGFTYGSTGYASWELTDSDAPLDSVASENPATNAYVNTTTTWWDLYQGATLADSTVPTTISGTHANRGAVWQLPEAVAPVTLPYNLGSTTFTKASSNSSVTSELDLTKDMVCYIWTQETAAGAAVSGAYNWNNPIFQAAYTTSKKPVLTQLSSNIGTVQGGSLAITPIHRPDGSGSTYLFTLWLSQNCAGYTAAGYSAPATIVTWPSYVTAAAKTGGGGMQSAVENTVGSIGYVDPSKVQPIGGTALPVPPAAFIASVGSTVKLPNFVYPTIAAVKATFANVAPPLEGSAYTKWGVALNKTFFKQKTGSYPIVGLTYIDGYQCYSNNSSATGSNGTLGDNYDGVIDLETFINTNSQAEALLESVGLVGLGVDTTTNSAGQTFQQAELATLTDTVGAPKTALIGIYTGENFNTYYTTGKNAGKVKTYGYGPKACPLYQQDANRS